MMPISEVDHYDGTYVNILLAVGLKELKSLPKHDTIRGYQVKKVTKKSRYHKEEVTWEIPKDKWGQDPFYKHYRLKVDYLLDSILIPIDVIKSEYPDLVSSGGEFCMGISKDKELVYKREFLLKEMLQ